jgi:hypothetical protein
MGEQARAGVGVQRPRRQPVVLAGAGEERLGEAQHVAPALPQRRQRHRDHGEAMVEVVPEAAFPSGGQEIGVRGADHPDVGRLAPGAAEAAHRALLERLQELGL